MKTNNILYIAAITLGLITSNATLAAPVAGDTHSNTYTMDVMADAVEVGVRHSFTPTLAVDFRAVVVPDLNVAPHVGLAFTKGTPLGGNVDLVWGFRGGITRFLDIYSTKVTIAPHVAVNFNGLTFGIEYREDIVKNDITRNVAFITRIDF